MYLGWSLRQKKMRKLDKKVYIFCQVRFSKCCIFIFLPDRLNIPERGKGRGNSLFKKIKKEKEAR